MLGATLGEAHFCFYVRQRQDLLRHLGKAHAQLLSYRAPGSTRRPHALSRRTSASAAKPSHCILHCARRCRLLGASVGALNARCDASAPGAHRAGLLRARRGYLVASLVSASAAQLLWSTSGPKGPRRRFRRRVPANPGRRAGDSAREAAAGRAWRRATGDLPPRLPPEAWFGTSPQAPFRPRASPQAPLTPVHELPLCPELPLEPPTPAWAQGFVLERIAPGLSAAPHRRRPPRPRSTLSAPHAPYPASYTHPSHPSYPTHRSRSRSPPRAAHTHRLRGSRPPYPSSPVYAQALRVALLPRPGSRAARRGGAVARAWHRRAGGMLLRPGGGQGPRWGGDAAPPRRSGRGSKKPGYSGGIFLRPFMAKS